MHRCLNSGSDRPKTSQAQQVQSRGSQHGYCFGAIAPVAMGFVVDLGVAEEVPAFNASAGAHQFEQGFWRCPQAGEDQVGRLKLLAITSARGSDFHAPARADPGFSNLLQLLFVPQGPGTVPTLADPAIVQSLIAAHSAATST